MILAFWSLHTTISGKGPVGAVPDYFLSGRKTERADSSLETWGCEDLVPEITTSLFQQLQGVARATGCLTGFGNLTLTQHRAST